ncbi:MAG: NAD(P)H-dependent oxidoreductase subunit E [Candidatus Fermentibacteraceae bacterium]|nr:NAD(P)H-dependent oxidoreductase subunit E [Candidatus Fermentibacteraceae bacterium]MBN2609822.1 NAD(P)H-dependent oxidoreductase subunit E [Candidatus Fermentibacteraceae bacterium]
MVDIKRVDAIIDKWDTDPEFVIEMMQDVQDEFRHIPRKALERISDRTGKPRGKLFHIATFYKAFSLEPRGEKEIQVCMGTACYVKGAPDVLAALERELGIRSGETTPDGKFTLTEVRCVGACGLAPVVTIGDEVIGGVKSNEVPRIMKRFREEGRE